jgi:hypothetical protein
MMDARLENIPPGLDDFPPTDESGDVDLSLIDYSLSLSLEERARRHYHARLFAERMHAIARQRYGSIIDDLKSLE